MLTYKQFTCEEISENLIVVFKNSPSNNLQKALFENFSLLDEGILKTWGNGYTYRLDRRPDNLGGDQIHIFGPRSQSWAYRHNGLKSEPNKYKSGATKIAKDIVVKVLGIDRSNIEEAYIVSVNVNEMIVEVSFL
jgi:hypothetical protein